MTFHCFYKRNQVSEDLVSAFAQGVVAQGHSAAILDWRITSLPKDGVVVTTNKNMRIIPQLLKGSLPYIIIDNSYIHENVNTFYRVCQNSLFIPVGPAPHPSPVVQRPARWRGDYILIAVPTSYLYDLGYLPPDWLDQTITRIRSTTDRPILLREKPRQDRPDLLLPLLRKHRGLRLSQGRSAYEDLNEAHSVVAPASSILVTAARMGRPTFCENFFSPALPFSCTDLSQIETFELDANAVHQSFLSLRASQFSLEELKQGAPIKSLKL